VPWFDTPSCRIVCPTKVGFTTSLISSASSAGRVRGTGRRTVPGGGKDVGSQNWVRGRGHSGVDRCRVDVPGGRITTRDQPAGSGREPFARNARTAAEYRLTSRPRFIGLPCPKEWDDWHHGRGHCCERGGHLPTSPHQEALVSILFHGLAWPTVTGNSTHTPASDGTPQRRPAPTAAWFVSTDRSSPSGAVSGSTPDRR